MNVNVNDVNVTLLKSEFFQNLPKITLNQSEGNHLKGAFPDGKSENGGTFVPGVKRKFFDFDPGT